MKGSLTSASSPEGVAHEATRHDAQNRKAETVELFIAKYLLPG